jgi:hypothetical protein
MRTNSSESGRTIIASKGSRDGIDGWLETVGVFTRTYQNTPYAVRIMAPETTETPDGSLPQKIPEETIQ